MIDAMTEGARRHPTHDLAVVPNGLIAQRIRVPSLELEGQEPQSAAVLLFHGRGTANELLLLEVHKSAEPGFEWTVDRTVFPRPGAEALLHSHAIERSTAEWPQVIFSAGTDQQIIERTLVIRGDPNFESQFARKGNAADVTRHHADFHSLEGQERKRRGRQVIAHQFLQQSARIRTGYG